MTPTNIWDEIRLRIQGKVNRVSYDTWFLPTAFVADDDRSVTVRVPNPLFRDWIAKHYSGVIGEALEEIRRRDTLISFIVAGLRMPRPAAIRSTSDSTASITNSALSEAMSV